MSLPEPKLIELSTRMVRRFELDDPVRVTYRNDRSGQETKLDYHLLETHYVHSSHDDTWRFVSVAAVGKEGREIWSSIEKAPAEIRVWLYGEINWTRKKETRG
jgi:hypothetical protein